MQICLFSLPQPESKCFETVLFLVCYPNDRDSIRDDNDFFRFLAAYFASLLAFLSACGHFPNPEFVSACLQHGTALAGRIT